MEASTSVEVLRAQRAYNQPRALPFVHLPFNGISRAEPFRARIAWERRNGMST